MTRGVLRGSILLLGILLLMPPAARADEECEVSASAQQMGAVEGYKYTAYTFEVALEIEEQCAAISYLLVIDERLPDGELRKKTMSRALTLRSNAVTEYHEYKTSRVNVIEGIVVEGIRCNVCL